MDIKKHFSILLLAMLAVLAFYSSPATACSCMPSHPQTHFCNADYVVLIRVLRMSRRLVANKIVYKVEIKKAYKINEEGRKMLKHGRIVTADSSALCGVSLAIGKLYMIAGRAPQLNSCNYYKEYQKMTTVERRGFTGVYRKGCKCHVKPCFGTNCQQNIESSTSCKWSPFARCETNYSACTRKSYATPEGVITKCHWRPTREYMKCKREP